MATAKAQSVANRETAVTQYGLAATNQKTPTGSLTYEQIGTWPDGTPRYQATTALSPEQQNLYNLNTATQSNLGNIGVEQSNRIRGVLNEPFDINAARGEKLADINRTFLDPQWARNDEALRTDLFNRGIRPGSEAYDAAVQDAGDAKARAYDRMFLDSYERANTAALTERNQPLNEITALLRGSGVQQPNLTGTPTPGVAPTDVIGAQQQSLNQQNIGYQADVASNNALMGGLFGLGGTALGGWMKSDRRVKRDIVPLGRARNGLMLYAFRFRNEPGAHVGYMADEVARVRPDAVKPDRQGWLHVNYAVL